MEKIQKTSRIICMILRVLFWICVIGGIGAVIAQGAVLMMPQEQMEAAAAEGMSTSIELGFVTVNLLDASSVVAYRSLFVCTLVTTVATVVFGCWSLHLLLGIFRPMAKGTPFNGAVSATLKKLAGLEFGFGAAFEVLKMVIQAVYYKAFDIAALFDAQQVASTGVNLVMDCTFIVVFILLMLLSHVFRYGEERQADETL